MLTKIWVDGFRSLNDFTFEPKQGLNVLVGANGAGKTNIIDFLKFIGLLNLYNLNDALIIMGGTQKNFRRFGENNSNEIKFKVTSQELKKYEYYATIKLDEKLGVYFEEQKYFIDNVEQHLTFVEDEIKNGLHLIEPLIFKKAPIFRFLNNTPNAKIFNFEPKAIKLFNDFSSSPHMREDGGFFVAHLDYVKQIYLNKIKNGLVKQNPNGTYTHDLTVNPYEYILPYASMIRKDFVDFLISRDSTRDEITCYIKFKTEEGFSEVPITHVSDGTAKWFALCLAVVTNSWLNLEEPENFLHPELQRIFIKILRERMEETGGIAIISTHSETILNHIKPEEVVIVSLENGKTKANRISDAEHLNDVIRESGFGLGYFFATGSLE